MLGFVVANFGWQTLLLVPLIWATCWSHTSNVWKSLFLISCSSHVYWSNKYSTRYTWNSIQFSLSSTSFSQALLHICKLKNNVTLSCTRQIFWMKGLMSRKINAYVTKLESSHIIVKNLSFLSTCNFLQYQGRFIAFQSFTFLP
jgi:hypothetical protein